MSDSQPSRSRRDFLGQWLNPSVSKEAKLSLTRRAVAEAEAPAASSSAAKSPAVVEGHSYLLQVARRAMAAEFQIYLNAGQDPAAPEAAVEALELLDMLEDQLSVYRPRSEISQLNATAHLRPVRVELRLFYLLQLACQLHRDTDGAFDITAGPLSKVWGFHERQGRIPPPAALAEALQRVGSQGVQLEASSLQVSFSKAGVELNLGGIGKGYALDRCAAVLTERGVTDFLIQGGLSSVLAHGRRWRGSSAEQQAWKIGLTHPLVPRRRLGEVLLCDQALGTSGCGNQYFHDRGRRYGHILDPRTGWPAQGVFASTVLAATAARADALATAFYVMGPEAAAKYCQQHPDVGAILACAGDHPGELHVQVLGTAESVWRPAAAEEERGDSG